jgi:hypothetical protein
MKKTTLLGLVIGAIAVSLATSTLVISIEFTSATSDTEKFNARDVAPGNTKKESGLQDARLHAPGHHQCDSNLISPGHVKDGSGGCGGGGGGGGDGGGLDD